MSLSYFSNFAILLILGRFMTGVYTGLACALVPLYVQQISPKTIKVIIQSVIFNLSVIPRGH